MLDFNSLALQCAPNVHPTILRAVVRTESGFNPFAIGVVGGRLVRQPRDRAEAVATAKALEAQGINFSVGLGQVNKRNLARYGLTYETAFDPCENLRVGGAILHNCYERAVSEMRKDATTLRATISCYYSGNFTRGEAADANGTSYVQRVVANARAPASLIGVVGGGGPVRQPRDRVEAVATAEALEEQGIDFSLGGRQVDHTNLARYGLTYETSFGPCEDLRAGSGTLQDCYERAASEMGQCTTILRAAISCYYNGSFTRGEAPDTNSTSYAPPIVAKDRKAADPTDVVPAIPLVTDNQSGRPTHALAPVATTSSAHSSPK